MKAQVSATETVTLVVMSAMYILFILQMPKIFKDFFDEIATANSQVVASDMAGLISVSAVAPEDIVIQYHGIVKDINYTVNLKDGNITVEMLRDGKPLENPSENKYAIVGLNRYIENQKKFEIKKDAVGLVNTYDFRKIYTI